MKKISWITHHQYDIPLPKNHKFTSSKFSDLYKELKTKNPSMPKRNQSGSKIALKLRRGLKANKLIFPMELIELLVFHTHFINFGGDVFKEIA